jgi:outer membrane protein
LLGTYDWGFQVSVPIFNGFGREARIAEAEARTRELGARRRDLEGQVALEVRSVELDLVSAREQVDAARERRRLATQELAQARDRFQAGVAGSADVITALLGLNQARTLEVEALTAFRTAVVGRAKAQGDLLELR